MGNDGQHILPQGYQLQEYRVDDILGEGGFGITYLATDANLGFAVAIKEYFPLDTAVRTADHSVVPRSQQSRELFQWGLERFLEEANRLAQFRGHRNIVRVNRVIRENQTAYFVMEYEEGESLHAVLEREAPLEEDRLRFLISEVLDGLEEVHSREILHRDIKPDNIFVRKDGVPVLLDFGSARRDQRSKALTGIVAEGYSPLEQYASDSENQGVWSDIYALGATIHHAISGAPPPPSPRRRLKDTMIPAVEAGAGQYDADFLDAVDWALGITPDQRPPDVARWREALFPNPQTDRVSDGPPAGEAVISAAIGVGAPSVQNILGSPAPHHLVKPHAIETLTPSTFPEAKECPRCAEIIKLRARYCLHCKYEYSAAEYEIEKNQIEDGYREREERYREEAEERRKSDEEVRLSMRGVSYKGFKIRRSERGLFEVFELDIKLRGSSGYASIEEAKRYINLISVD